MNTLVEQNPGAAVRPKLLLVEDDAAVRRSLQLLLRGRGYEVRAYESGRQMLADPTAAEAVCLIADYRMDDMDGLAVLRDLRSRGWHCLAILITAYDAEELTANAREAGFDAVLQKPLRDLALLELLDRKARHH